MWEVLQIPGNEKYFQVPFYLFLSIQSNQKTPKGDIAASVLGE